MPQPQEIRRFANGKTGRWDGQGWEEIPTTPPGPQPNTEDPHGAVSTAITKFGLPGAGGFVGGKIGGPVGSGVGAAVGQAYGDIYNMLTGGPVPTPGEEASKLAATAGLTTLGEKILPPVIRTIGNLIPKGMGGRVLGGSALGYLFGHPAAGAAVGAAGEMAPQIARGIEYLGEPAGAAAGSAARQEFMSGIPTGARNSQGIVSAADKVSDQVRRDAGGWMAEGVPADSYLRPSNAINALKGYAEDAWGAAKGAFNKVDDFMTRKPLRPDVQLQPPGTDLYPRPTPPAVKYPQQTSNNPLFNRGAEVEVAPELNEITQPGLGRMSTTPGGSTVSRPGAAQDMLNMSDDEFRAATSRPASAGAQQPYADSLGAGARRDFSPLRGGSSQPSNFTPVEYAPGTSNKSTPEEWNALWNDFTEAQENPGYTAQVRQRIVDGLKGYKP